MENQQAPPLLLYPCASSRQDFFLPPKKNGAWKIPAIGLTVSYITHYTHLKNMQNYLKIE